MTYEKYSTEFLAERWMDQRQIQNLVGRYVYDKLVRREGGIFDRYWCTQSEPELGLNEGFYLGETAIREYYAAVDANTAVRSAHMKKLFPDFLGPKSDAETHGVGSLYIDALAGCVIEVAEDGKTAKGLWSVMGMDSDIYEFGPCSFWKYGVIAGDFVRENGEWRIWHLRDIEDISCPCGENWGHEWSQPETKPEFAALAGLTLPEPTVKEPVRERFYPGRPNSALARVPEPYAHFEDTFTYGYEKGGAE